MKQKVREEGYRQVGKKKIKEGKGWEGKRKVEN